MSDMPQKAVVEFQCTGIASGKMRNDLEVTMVRPMRESFTLATDEGAFHGGDATAPPPLALFVGSLTGCVMTQIRAFAKRLGVTLDGLQVHVTVEWDWQATGVTYETAPKSFAVDVMIDSPDPFERLSELVATARKGCFIEQTLGQANRISHRIKTPDGWITV